jgi:hypothetical protein
MQPDNIELCSALIIVGALHTVVDSVRPEALHRLAELGFVQGTGGKWDLTATGRKLLPAIQDGDHLPDFS